MTQKGEKLILEAEHNHRIVTGFSGEGIPLRTIMIRDLMGIRKVPDRGSGGVRDNHHEVIGIFERYLPQACVFEK